MKNTTYRILAVAAVLLTLCLVFAAPVSADSIEVASAEELQSSISDGVTIKLKGDIAGDVSVADYKTGLIIDGNGYSMSGNLTLGRTNAGEVMSGSVTVKNITFTNGHLYIRGYATVNVENNTFTGSVGPIEAGRDSSTAESNQYGAITVAHSTSLVINGNNISNALSGYTRGIEVFKFTTTAEITDNTIDGTASTSVIVVDGSGAAAVTGNILKNWGQKNDEGRALRVATTGVVTFMDNTLSSTKTPEEFVKITGASSVTSSGNTFNDVPNDKVIRGGSGTTYLYDLVAQIDGTDGTYYSTLQDAVNAGSDKTVTLNKNVVVDKPIVITAATVTLVGDGHSITNSSKFPRTSEDHILWVKGDSFTMERVIIDDSMRATFKTNASAAIRLDGKSAKLTGNIIYAGEAPKHRSTGILVNGSADNTELVGNEIHLGKANTKGWSYSDKYRNESIGIRIYPGTNSGGTNGDPIKGLVIKDNTFMKSAGSAFNHQVGIMIDGAQPGDEISVTGNTFNLGTSFSDVIRLVCARNAVESDHPSLNLTFSGNSVTAVNYLSLLKDKTGGLPFTQNLTVLKDADGKIDAIGNIVLGNSTSLSIDAGLFAENLQADYLAPHFHTKKVDGGWEVTDLWTVTFAGSSIPAIEVANKTVITEPAAPSKADYNFGGWYTDAGSAYDFSTPVTSHLTLNAKWTEVSGGSGSSTPATPVTPVEPETPVEEPAAGEATVETTVTDGGEVAFETPAADGSEPAADAPVEIEAVVLPSGTDSAVTFIPVSEQPAPAGQEENTKKVFEINVPTYDEGKPATIKFTMTVAELEADGKTAADVALWHFDEETGEWTKLLTTFTIVDGIVYFEAVTFGFSPFAIIYADETPVTPDVPDTPETPETPASPAPVLAVFAALGAAAVLRRK